MQRQALTTSYRLISCQCLKKGYLGSQNSSPFIPLSILIAEHGIIRCGIFLHLAGVSCPSCMCSQLLAHPQSTHSGGSRVQSGKMTRISVTNTVQPQTQSCCEDNSPHSSHSQYVEQLSVFYLLKESLTVKTNIYMHSCVRITHKLTNRFCGKVLLLSLVNCFL